MASDWIKFEKSTLAKPEILAVASALGIHRLHAVGLCLSFWSWCDDQLSECHAPSVTEKMIDDVIGVTGFASALISVGWLRSRNGSIEVPNFDRHMSESAKIRSLSRIRQAKKRHGDVTKMSRYDRDKSVTREEKRREEKNKDKIHSATAVASDKKPTPKSTRTPRPRDELYDAIAAATGCQGSHVGKVAAELRKAEPPFTVAEVAEFGQRFYELCPHAIGGPPRLPNVGELEKYISRVRATKPTAPTANLQSQGMTAKTREAIAVHDDLDRMIAEARERERLEKLQSASQPLALGGVPL